MSSTVHSPGPGLGGGRQDAYGVKFMEAFTQVLTQYLHSPETGCLCIFHNRQPTCLTLAYTTICHPSLHICDLMGNTLTPDEGGRKVPRPVYNAIHGPWSETNHCCTVPFGTALKNNRKEHRIQWVDVKEYILCSLCL